MSFYELLRIAATVFAAVTFVVIGDTAGKLLTGMGVAPFIVAWSRFAIAALILFPFSGLAFNELSQFADWRVLLRAIAIVGGICFILTALMTEPIANVFGAFFIGPVVSYVLAILFLGERPSVGRSSSLALGFFGVMLVVKPGFGASTGMVYALAAGCCYGTYLVLTRLAAGHYRPRFLLISQLLIGSAILTPIGVGLEFPPFSFEILALVMVSALGSALGNFLLVMANRKADASLIAPLVYTQLISATVLGVIVFGDWPDAWSFLGLGLIAASGLGSLLVDRRVALF